MPGPKKKSFKELEMEVTELIAKSGQCKQDILTDFNTYCVLKKKSNTPGSILKDHDIC